MQCLGTARPGRLGTLGAAGIALLFGFAIFAACDDALSDELPLGQARTALELRLGRAIEEMLEPLVGAGKARAEVSAELDPERATVNSEIVDPDSQVQRSVRTVEEGQKSDTTTTYEFSRTVKTLAREAGQLKRLSVAVLVDYALADGKSVPRAPEEMETLARLVRSAIGFNAERGDKVEFFNLRFAELPPRGSRGGAMPGLSNAELMRLGELLIVSIAVLLGLLVVARALAQRRPALATAVPATASPVPAPIMPMPEPERPARETPRAPQAAPARDATVWDKLTQVNEATLANYLAQENPQTISLVLSRLDAAHAARVLAQLPVTLATGVMQRMLRLEPVEPQVLDAVERVLSAEFAQSLARAPAPPTDGHAAVARILDKLDRGTEQRIVAALERQNRGGAERVKSRMIGFDDLAQLSIEDARALLREVKPDKLAVALKAAAEATRKLFLDALPERSSRVLRQEIAALGPVRLREVDEAQAAILNVAKEMALRGEIVLGDGDSGPAA